MYPHPAQQFKKIKWLKRTARYDGTNAVPATQEGEAGRLLEPRNYKPGWPTQRDPITEREGGRGEGRKER
jgi:hypothetical protein